MCIEIKNWEESKSDIWTKQTSIEMFSIQWHEFLPILVVESFEFFPSKSFTFFVSQIYSVQSILHLSKEYYCTPFTRYVLDVTNNFIFVPQIQDSYKYLIEFCISSRTISINNNIVMNGMPPTMQNMNNLIRTNHCVIHFIRAQIQSLTACRFYA